MLHVEVKIGVGTRPELGFDDKEYLAPESVQDIGIDGDVVVVGCRPTRVGRREVIGSGQ